MNQSANEWTSQPCRTICVIFIGLVALFDFAHAQKCPRLSIESTDLDNDIAVSKTMYRPSWPQNAQIYQRILPVSASRVTPYLDNSSAQKGIELINVALLRLPNVATLVDVSVRLRAVQQFGPPTPKRPPIIELGSWSGRPPHETYETCRLAEYGIDPDKPNDLGSVAYPVIDAGSSVSIDWSAWIPRGMARIAISNDRVVLLFDRTEGTWNHRFFWDAVVYYSRN
jgi:hypothetical protein